MKKYNDKLIFYRTKSGAIACLDPTKGKCKKLSKTSTKNLAIWKNKQISLKGKPRRKVLDSQFEDIWLRREDTKGFGKIGKEKRKRIITKPMYGDMLATDSYMTTKSVKDEYNIKLPEGKIDYNGKRRRPDEERVAHWLAKMFGGDVVFDLEQSGDGYKHYDVEWREKAIEIKTPTNISRVDDRLQKGIGKVYKIKGHILDAVLINIEDTSKITKKQALKTIYTRMNLSCYRKTDVIIKYGDEMLDVLRIEHKKQ